jgi:hypothetical protein
LAPIASPDETVQVIGRKVAVACCRRSAEADPTDLYPDPDAVPLQAALRELGARSTLVAWDDPAAEWGSFSHVVVSSTWDSVDRPVEYLAWAHRVTSESVLVNPTPVIEWCLDKVHQRGLAAADVPTVPTTWVTPKDTFTALPAREFVVKPSVSAGGRSTARYTPADTAALGHVRALQEVGQTVMVQEYLAKIDDEGEVDLVYFNGSFSHAVAKKPLLHAGEGVIDRPWERMAWGGLVAPSTDQLAVADLTLKVVAEQVGCVPVYGRVDLANGGAGEPLVLEVELIDPYLSLDMEPSAAGRMAKTILHR